MEYFLNFSEGFRKNILEYKNIKNVYHRLQH